MGVGKAIVTLAFCAALAPFAVYAAPAAKDRIVEPQKAPPRVFDGILGFLKNSTLSLSGGNAATGANNDATRGKTLSDLLGSGRVNNVGTGTLSGSSGNAGASASGNSSGASADATPPKNDGSDDDKLGYDENNKSPNADKANAAANKKDGGKAPADGGLVKNPLYWPICFFIDQSMPASKGNEIVKGVVDMANKCGVTVTAFPVTARGFIDDPDTINKQQQAACNVTEVGFAPLASTTALVPFTKTAGHMCGDFEPDKDPTKVAGCAQKSRGGSPPAPSIEVIQGWSAGVTAHEAMGHSQMDMPNLGEEDPPGSGNFYNNDAGNGIGLPSPGDKASKNGGGTEAGIGGFNGWTPAGCAQMYKNALPNDKGHLYDPNRSLYYVRQDDPERQFEMGSGRKIFSGPEKPPPPGPGQSPPLAGGDGATGSKGLSGGFNGGEAVVSRPPVSTNGGFGQGSQNTVASGNASGLPPKPGGRHDVKSGSAPTLSELRQKNPPKEPGRDDSFAVVSQKPAGGGAAASPFSGGGGGERVRIDESASANTGVSSVGTSGRVSGGAIFDASSGSSGASFGGGGGGSSGKVGFDESMTASGATATVGTSGSPPKLFLGKGNAGGGGGGTPFQSALSGDFFTKAKLGDGESEGDASSSRIRGKRPSRGIASSGDDESGGDVRSLRKGGGR